MIFSARRLEETSKNSGRFHVVSDEVCWDPINTAVIICDMWDRHTCKSAEARVNELAPVMNRAVGVLRSEGMLIIHAPSDTMEFYKDYTGRKLALSAPVVKTAVPLEKEGHFDAEREKDFPIDNSDCSCDCEPECSSCLPPYPWTRQNTAIEIRDGDAIGDSLEIIYLMKQLKIENVIIMGVHTNYCILDRPFGIRQLVKQGFNAVLVRDMTDTIYNPRVRPHTDHFTGTDMVVWHIEKYWCPTITSDQITGGAPFRFKADTRMVLPKYGD